MSLSQTKQGFTIQLRQLNRAIDPKTSLILKYKSFAIAAVVNHLQILHFGFKQAHLTFLIGFTKLLGQLRQTLIPELHDSDT